MSNDLTILEHELEPLAPRMEKLLAGVVPTPRMMTSIIVSCERMPRLLAPELRGSLLTAALSLSALQLEADGVTGQAYMIPFGGRVPRVQALIGYKGYNTIAARAGISIFGAVVREGDLFEFELGTTPYIKHKPLFAGPSDRRIIGSYAVAQFPDAKPVPVVLSIDDIEAIRARSSGAGKSDSPWNDPRIGFPAMCEKSAKRRLARVLPQGTFQLAARMEEAVLEQGRHAFIREDRTLHVEGDATVREITPAQAQPQPKSSDLLGPRWDYIKANGATQAMPSMDAYLRHMQNGIAKIGAARDLEEIWKRQAPTLKQLDAAAPEEFARLEEAYRSRLLQLGGSP